MKITLELDTTNSADAPLIGALMKIEIIDLSTPAGSVPGAAPAAKADPVPAPEPTAKVVKAETPAAKKKRLAAAAAKAAAVKKAAADAAADEKRAADAAAATEADDLLVDGPAEVTIDELKAVVKATIERVSVDKVKAVFTAHDALNISALTPEIYAEVKAELEAL